MFADLHGAIAARLNEKTLMKRNREGGHFCLMILLAGTILAQRGPTGGTPLEN